MSRGVAAALVSSDPAWAIPDLVPASGPVSIPTGPAGPGPRIPVRIRRRLPARRVLPDAPALFGWLGNRFAPGEATIWTGASSAIDRLLELLYAGSTLADGRISLLEGANRFNPYRIAEQGQALGLEPDPVLAGIRLARAFTAYQLVALVDGWSAEARRRRPTLLIGHELPALFGNPEELPPEEREPLLRYVAERLADLVEGTGLPLLLTVSEGVATFPGLAEKGPRFCDLVRLIPRPAGVELASVREGRRLLMVHRSPGQLGLEEFAPPDATQEVNPWAAPPLPTVRHSRND
ncbi:MAG: hypothetical protein L3K14_01175 [Thermoplasmata archaeon]|nr:hypothetical protein [Thermoplasmata archaeon]